MNGNIGVPGVNNYKQKYDFLNFAKMNNAKSKLKLLKPKINASNGGKNLISPNVLNVNMPVLPHPQKISKFYKGVNENPSQTPTPTNGMNKNGFMEILKNPKIKFPLKTKQRQGVSEGNNLKTIVGDSTAITAEEKVNKDITDTTCATSKIKLDDSQNRNVKTKVNSNFHKIKDLRLRKDKHNRTLNTSSLYYDNEYSSTPQNRSIKIHNSKSLLAGKNEDISPIRGKSQNSRKHGIQIIDQIIQGLTKLKTIIAEDEEDVVNEDDIGGIIRHSTNLFSKKSTIDPQQLLISSTTGEQIAVENKRIFRMMKDKPTNHKTIDPDESGIQHEEEAQISNINNDSLMMQIKTEKRSKSFIGNRYSSIDGSRENEGDKKDRKLFRIKNNPGGLNGDTIINKSINQSIPLVAISNNKGGEKLKVKRSGSHYISNQNPSLNLTSQSIFKIDKFEYKVVNEDKNTRRQSGRVKSSLRLIKNDSNYFSAHNNNNTQATINYSSNTPTNVRPVKPDYSKKLKDMSINNDDLISVGKRTIKIDDDFANYEFID